MGLTLWDEVGKSGLSPSCKRVAFAYARKADDDTGDKCFPGAAWIADMVGLKLKAVYRYRKELEDLGVIDLNAKRFNASKLPKRDSTSVDSTSVESFSTPVEQQSTVVERHSTTVERNSTSVEHTSNVLAKITSTKNKQVPAVRDVAPDGAAIKKLIGVYAKAFRQRFNIEPTIVRGRDGKLAKEMIRDYGAAEAVDLVHAFFASADPFIVSKSDYTIPALKRHAPGLRLAPVRIDARTAHDIDAALRASGGSFNASTREPCDVESTATFTIPIPGTHDEG